MSGLVSDNAARGSTSTDSRLTAKCDDDDVVVDDDDGWLFISEFDKRLIGDVVWYGNTNNLLVLSFTLSTDGGGGR